MTVRELVPFIASRYQLSPDLLTAQILVESGGDPFAFRYERDYFQRYIRTNDHALAQKFGPLAACSYGPLQIMLETAYEIGFTGTPQDLFEPAIGLEWGAKYLASLLTWANGDYHKAWCAYNGGKGAVASLPYPNQVYADKIEAMKGKALTT